MSEKPQLSTTLPTLVVVSGTASGLGTHIANQLVDCGVAFSRGSLRRDLFNQ
jgi:NADP-dependent 3-hydroxy acid dehydrogenase YdfG